MGTLDSRRATLLAITRDLRRARGFLRRIQQGLRLLSSTGGFRRGAKSNSCHCRTRVFTDHGEGACDELQQERSHQKAYQLLVDLRCRTLYIACLGHPWSYTALGLCLIDLKLLRALIQHPNLPLGNKQFEVLTGIPNLMGGRIYEPIARLRRILGELDARKLWKRFHVRVPSDFRAESWIETRSGLPEKQSNKGRGYMFSPGRRSYCMIDGPLLPQRREKKPAAKAPPPPSAENPVTMPWMNGRP